MSDEFNENNNPESIIEAIRPLLTMAKGISEQISPFMEQWSIVQKQLSDNFQKFSSIMNNYRLTFTPERMESFKRFGKLIHTIQALAEVQYTIWEFYSEDFIDLVYSSENVNKALLEFHVKNKFSIFKENINYCRHNLSKRELRIFNQAILSFDAKRYDIAVIGLLVVIDGYLSTITENLTETSIFTRSQTVLEKIDGNDDVSYEDFYSVAFIITFQETMASLSKNIRFHENEPNGLNRHWILHGRSTRRKTRLDCIKLVNFLYAITLIATYTEA